MKVLSVVLPLFLAISCVSGYHCPRGWMQFKTYCYFVSSSIKTWHQAQAYCKGLGGELVKINSDEENEFVLKLVHKRAPSVSMIWIGLQWNARVRGFIWSDLSIPKYRNWAPWEPNGNAREPCGNMWTGNTTVLPTHAPGYWNDRICQLMPRFPCGLVCKSLAEPDEASSPLTLANDDAI